MEKPPANEIPEESYKKKVRQKTALAAAAVVGVLNTDPSAADETTYGPDGSSGHVSEKSEENPMARPEPEEVLRNAMIEHANTVVHDVGRQLYFTGTVEVRTGDPEAVYESAKRILKHFGSDVQDEDPTFQQLRDQGVDEETIQKLKQIQGKSNTDLVPNEEQEAALQKMIDAVNPVAKAQGWEELTR